jgi:ribonuclease BN (tRNA processing enzyme)
MRRVDAAAKRRDNTFMRLVPLGTTGFHPNDLRHTACYLLPEVGIVLDAGTGMYRLAEHVTTDELDIFLTHAHLDHVVGLTYLLETLHARPMKRVTIHGDAAKLASIREHLFHRDLFPILPDVDWRPLPLFGPMPLMGDGTLTHFPLEHPGGSLGFRLDWPSKSLAYVTDATAGPKASYIEAIRGVDLLLHECNFGDDVPREFAEKTGHSRTSEVAALAKSADVRRLVLIHLAPHLNVVDPVGLDTARKIFPHTEIAEDLKAIEF